MMKRLLGQVAVVTGGSRGIGNSIAKRFAEEGANILIADIQEEEAKAAAAALLSCGVEAESILCDVTNLDDISRMTQYCENHFGRFDILVNNAGIQISCPSMQFSAADFDRLMSINIRGAFFCAQSAARIMRKHGGGKIINISSGNSRMMNIGRAPYCMAKAGINAMTAVLGAEWAMYNITVNAIAPGFLKTELLVSGIKAGRIREEQMMAVNPVGRFGEVEEIANLALYLASDESAYIVGQTIFCDGGWSTGILPDALDFVKERDPEH